MSSSAGSKSLLSSIGLLVAVMLGSVYAIAHRDELSEFANHAAQQAADAAGAKLAEQAIADADNDTASSNSSSGGEVELAANSGGHFETAAEVNGNEIDVMVDTGATLVALTYEDAERAGLYLKSSDFTQGVRTANGTAKVAPVTLSSITIGDITVRNVKGAVAEPGKLHKTLLGMSFLGRLSRVEMRSNSLVLHE
jgi:aspartyl protease family protein